MRVQAQVSIAGSRQDIWSVITDIDHLAETISGIDTIEVLERPDHGLVGLEWRETRTFMGKTATEVMWVTAATAGESYEVRAESHGFVYLSTFHIDGPDGRCTLTLSHVSTPQGFGAKVMGLALGWMLKGVMRKAFAKDLADVKAAVEQGAGAPAA